MKIFNHTTIKLSTADALRALLGKAIHVRTETEAVRATRVLSTTTTTCVDKIFPRKPPASLPAPYCNGQCGICSCISSQPIATEAK